MAPLGRRIVIGRSLLKWLLAIPGARLLALSPNPGRCPSLFVRRSKRHPHELATRCRVETASAAKRTATPATGNGPIERPASSQLSREGRLASRQTPASGRAAAARHPPRPAGTDIRRGEPPAGGSLPAFLRRRSSSKASSIGRRINQAAVKIIERRAGAGSTDAG